ncbi:MAG: PfaD family polyunsaturated fatty acid/polyketide biosynthesis protein [Acaryochloris sp. RU_4_1]|nr:PfaD family polyunsaturated fatty acid/polyketide biosynthesis protein [Acaryochloris sp. RU_4_1]NJR54283.1 PfaD family polyunsaturated fatty acid/polyketide biosynthesis protein [Acaryochloris sp. CRU_2_0]
MSTNTALIADKRGLPLVGNHTPSPGWQSIPDTIAFDPAGIQAKLLDLDQPCYVLNLQGRRGVVHADDLQQVSTSGSEPEIILALPPLPMQQLGDPDFQATYGLRYAYAAGAMAGGIASADLVIALGQAGMLGSFGAGGLAPDRIATAINRIQQALPQGAYAFNLIHSPNDPALERKAVELYLQYGVKTVEASAFLDLTANIVYYRAAGLSLNATQQIEIRHKVIAKLSRSEVAAKFLQPAPTHLLKELLAQGLITEQQAHLAQQVPMADDITVEADSAGHTDNRPLVCLLPAILSLRDTTQAQYGYARSVRVGAAGGIGTPESAIAALTMGAAYIVTGSINQSCIEADTSEQTKNLLAQAEMTDVMMAPAADMFEMGVRLQVLKRGTLFPVRAQKLYDLYRNYDSIESIPPTERAQIEKQIFRKSLDAVWQETIAFFQQRDPAQLEKVTNHPKRKMALIFRSYLGLSSRWSNTGEPGREIDYQIWCGPTMGAFNAWVKDSYLADPKQRQVVDVAHHILRGAAFLQRLQSLQIQGLRLPPPYTRYHPQPMDISKLG